MTFNNVTKEELNKMAKYCVINITYYDGYIVMFDKVSVRAITPHMLVYSKNGDYLIVFHYDKYHDDDDLFFVDGEKYTLLTIKNILEIISKINLI